MEVGLVFTIIFVVIVIVFLLTIGADQIMKIFGLGEDAQIANTVNKLQDSIESVYWSAIGSTQPFEFGFTAGMDSACFLDAADPSANPELGWVGDPLVESLIKANNYTVVVFKKNREYSGFHLEKARPSQNFCIGVAKDINLLNMGTWVDIQN